MLKTPATSSRGKSNPALLSRKPRLVLHKKDLLELKGHLLRSNGVSFYRGLN